MSKIPKTVVRIRSSILLEKLSSSLRDESNNYDGSRAARAIDALIVERIANAQGTINSDEVPNPKHPDNQDDW